MLMIVCLVLYQHASPQQKLTNPAAVYQVLSVLASATETEADPDARDAETRMLAVAALVKVALKAGPAEPQAVDNCVPREVLVETVVGSLLRAVEDYATDSRGKRSRCVEDAGVARFGVLEAGS